MRSHHTSVASSFFGRFCLALYRVALCLFYPLGLIWIRKRLVQGKETPERLPERFGHPSKLRPSGPLFWFHAASVGESMSVLGLIEVLLSQHPSLSILITTGTHTSARLLTERFATNPRVIHQMLPFDWPWCVKRFLTFWKPDGFVLIENDLWPTLLHSIQIRHIPFFWLNAQLSTSSVRFWKIWNSAFQAMTNNLLACLTVSLPHAERLMNLGIKNVTVSGSLKWTAPAPILKEDLFHTYNHKWKDRFVLLATSTHPEDEDFILDTYRILRTTHPKFQVILVLVPRHVHRARALRQLLKKNPHTASVEVVGQMGILGTFYKLADVTFVGGSLNPNFGGHNVIEPALCKTPFLYGPYMNKQQNIISLFEAEKLSHSVNTPQECADAIRVLLKSPHERDRRIQGAYAVAMKQQEHVLGECLKVFKEPLTIMMSKASPSPDDLT